jgi:Fic family protein
MSYIQNFKSFIAGTYKTQFQYKSFTPCFINMDWKWEDPAINIMLEKANLALGGLDAYTHLVPDIDLYILMHKIKEAQRSSRIEGTQTAIEEVLMEEDDILPEKRDDWKEVQNYIHALNWSIDELDNLPLSNRLIKKTHYLLMQGVRGEHKQPGEFRKSQNWIGGSHVSDAVYIPPHHEEVPELMSDLEKFWHNEEIQVPHLIKIALSHYQFETIHPFLDGNGRIGRLLIILYLVNFQILSKPSLFISAFFEKHRSSYYDALSRVRASNDLTHWTKFFLNGIIHTAKKAQETFKEILILRTSLDKVLLAHKKKSRHIIHFLSFLYKKPVFHITDITEQLQISPTTAYTLVKQCMQLDIIKEMTGNKRNRLYMFHAYINLFME